MHEPETVEMAESVFVENRKMAIEKVMDPEKIYTGLIYEEDRAPYEDILPGSQRSRGTNKYESANEGETVK